MLNRRMVGYEAERKKEINILLGEALNGITEMDILPNSAQPMHGEVEAMYFKSIRNFMENTISRTIMNHDQDIFRGAD